MVEINGNTVYSDSVLLNQIERYFSTEQTGSDSCRRAAEAVKNLYHNRGYSYTGTSYSAGPCRVSVEEHPLTEIRIKGTAATGAVADVLQLETGPLNEADLNSALRRFYESDLFRTSYSKVEVTPFVYRDHLVLEIRLEKKRINRVKFSVVQSAENTILSSVTFRSRDSQGREAIAGGSLLFSDRFRGYASELAYRAMLLTSPAGLRSGVNLSHAYYEFSSGEKYHYSRISSAMGYQFRLFSVPVFTGGGPCYTRQSIENSIIQTTCFDAVFRGGDAHLRIDPDTADRFQLRARIYDSGEAGFFSENEIHSVQNSTDLSLHFNYAYTEKEIYSSDALSYPVFDIRGPQVTTARVAVSYLHTLFTAGPYFEYIKAGRALYAAAFRLVLNTGLIATELRSGARGPARGAAEYFALFSLRGSL